MSSYLAVFRSGDVPVVRSDHGFFFFRRYFITEPLPMQGNIERLGRDLIYCPCMYISDDSCHGTYELFRFNYYTLSLQHSPCTYSN